MRTSTRIETRPFGATGMQVTRIGLGAAQMGVQGTTKAEAKKVLNTMLDDGMNVIDTSSDYGDSEELIGHALADRRDDFLIFTKCGNNKNDFDTKIMAQEIDRSLKRLKTDHVDLVQIHTCPKAKLEQGDVIEVLQRAKEAGKTMYIGYSGDSDAALYAVECGAFDTLQISVNIFDQEPMDLGILRKAKLNKMGVLSKRSIANTCWRENPNDLQDIDPYQERARALRYDFLDEELPDAVGHALRFTMAVPEVDCCLIGMRSLEHWKENLNTILGEPLSPAEYEDIRDQWQNIQSPNWRGVN